VPGEGVWGEGRLPHQSKTKLVLNRQAKEGRMCLKKTLPTTWWCYYIFNPCFVIQDRQYSEFDNLPNGPDIAASDGGCSIEQTRCGGYARG
jgi:hypothetical protein